MIKIITRKYPHIHQLHTLYVEKKTGYVHIDNRRPLFEGNNPLLRYLRKQNNWLIVAAIKYWDAIFSHLILETETMNEIKKIVKKRKNEQESKSNQKEEEEENA
jgi:predicted metal-dependent RNase